MRAFLPLLAVIVISSPAHAAGDDDAVWLRSDEGRPIAMRVLRDHYQDLLDTLGSLRLSVSSGSPADYPPGAFADGRRAVPRSGSSISACKTGSERASTTARRACT